MAKLILSDSVTVVNNLVDREKYQVKKEHQTFNDFKIQFITYQSQTCGIENYAVVMFPLGEWYEIKAETEEEMCYLPLFRENVIKKLEEIEQYSYMPNLAA